MIKVVVIIVYVILSLKLLRDTLIMTAVLARKYMMRNPKETQVSVSIKLSDINLRFVLKFYGVCRDFGICSRFAGMNEKF